MGIVLATLGPLVSSEMPAAGNRRVGASQTHPEASPTALALVKAPSS